MDLDIAPRQGAGLVERDGIDTSQLFHIGSAFEQNPFPCPVGDGREDGGRRRQDDGARGRDHQEDHGSIECDVMPQSEP